MGRDQEFSSFLIPIQLISCRFDQSVSCENSSCQPLPAHVQLKPCISTAEKNPDAVKKEFTFYAGSCSGDEQEALMEIKKNFLEAVKSSPLAKYLLCDASDNLDCVMENVKVYCGANSKRSVDNTRIVKFNVVLKDTNPTPDRIKEAAQYVFCLIFSCAIELNRHLRDTMKKR